ncbi:MAG: spermidine synthase [Ignavibacteria bacterium]|nr:spermidine synthase [Ignavibacteria bacterium]
MIKKYIIIALISVNVISLEIIWTRIFSAEFFYTFAYLIISLAIAGLGIGALMLRTSKYIEKKIELKLSLSLTALFSLIAPPIVFSLGLDFSRLMSSPGEIIKIFLAICFLMSGFFFAGISIARIFRENSESLPKLYQWDLIGAGCGVFVAVLAMNFFETPIAAAFCGLPTAISAILLADKKSRVLPIMIISAMILFSFFSKSVLEAASEDKAPVIHKHWDAMSKIKIRKYNENYYGLQTDNTSGSTVIGFDGNFNRPDSLKFDYGINAGYLISQFQSCRFFSLGAGGGMDVMQALFEGASQIHAVEVNPYINELMEKGMLYEFTGKLYSNPKVTVITEDARAYIRRMNNSFDFIFARNSNSYAALASGAFALAENYLFTTEAFQDYWRGLSDSGFLMMDHQTYIPRVVSAAINALKMLGVQQPESHIAVYNSQEFHRKILLLSKKPLTREIILNAFGPLTKTTERRIQLIYPDMTGSKNDIITQIINKGWESAADLAQIDISPTTDDRPFIAQTGLWRNLEKANTKKVLASDEFYGFPVSQIIILIILIVSICIILPLNLLPYRQKGKKPEPRSMLYFFLIGLAYISVEIVLIQKYTLFIGPSSYSIITILAALLISSGIGSRFSKQISERIFFPALLILIFADIFLFHRIVLLLGDLTIFPRIAVTFGCLFPLGFFMGMPFPKAGARAGAWIDWLFAINGTASVIGSALIMLVSINFGFSTSLTLAAFFYGGAFYLSEFRTNTKLR